MIRFGSNVRLVPIRRHDIDRIIRIHTTISSITTAITTIITSTTTSVDHTQMVVRCCYYHHWCIYHNSIALRVMECGKWHTDTTTTGTVRTIVESILLDTTVIRVYMRESSRTSTLLRRMNVGIFMYIYIYIVYRHVPNSTERYLAHTLPTHSPNAWQCELLLHVIRQLVVLVLQINERWHLHNKHSPSIHISLPLRTDILF